jgi:hypothetical protein
MQPLYTLQNTTPAYQLNWSVSLFAKCDLPPPSGWLAQLRSDTERDGVRILDFCNPKHSVGQFFVSTLPTVTPTAIVRSLKGRWQHHIRSSCPSGFRRNYSISSVGEAKSTVLDRYVGRQAVKHVMADPVVQRRFETLQFRDSKVNLNEEQRSNFGMFVYCLQLVFETVAAWNEVRTSVLAGSRDMIIRTAAKKGWRLSRIGILSNHMHVLLGASMGESPADVALSLMNNLAYVQGMKPVYRHSYYVGTFGRYDRNAIRRRL